MLLLIPVSAYAAEEEAKVCLIKWKNTSSYVTEGNDGGLAIGAYSTRSRVFWEFIPTENADCYYIRSCATGKYIGSCNKTPSSASTISTGTNPVEYYVGQTSATTGDIAGCVWLSSTDCANYSNEATESRCLNKDGASSNIITWKNGVTHQGSYWTLVETENLYDNSPRPRNQYALENQIYQIPCGSVGKQYVKTLTIGSGFRYPMATAGRKDVTYPNGTKPENKYTIVSRDVATVGVGENPVTIGLNAAPADIRLFFDWDHDGVFEAEQVLEPAKSIETVFSVPQDAKPGTTRMRVRVNSNGLNGPDDDVNGHIVDVILRVADAAAEPIAPEVSVNAADRGEASWADGLATATPKGASLFLYWKNGARVAAITPDYAVEAGPYPQKLTAYFGPNVGKLDGIDPIVLGQEAKGSISLTGGKITVKSDSAVAALLIYGLDGSLQAQTRASELTPALPSGIYIAKAITAQGIITAKIKL